MQLFQQREGRACHVFFFFFVAFEKVHVRAQSMGISSAVGVLRGVARAIDGGSVDSVGCCARVLERD